MTLPDTSTVEFVYDADGNRVSRANGDDSTRYVAGLMEIDLDQTTVVETRTFYSFAGTSVTVRAHTAGTVAFSFGNHLGSPVAALEDTTNTVSRMGYEPYGTERAVTGSLPSDHRFTNQIADNTTHPSGGTGLLFYNARYYDPEVGAFVAGDTLIPDPTSPVDFNRYAYVRGNPVSNTDPSGHETCGYRDGVYYCWSELEMIAVGAVNPDGSVAGPEFTDVAAREAPPKPGLGESKWSSLRRAAEIAEDHARIRRIQRAPGSIRKSVEHTQRVRRALPDEDKPLYGTDAPLGYALDTHNIENLLRTWHATMPFSDGSTADLIHDQLVEDDTAISQAENVARALISGLEVPVQSVDLESRNYRVVSRPLYGPSSRLRG